MKSFNPGGFWNSLVNASSERLSWLWLAIGAVLTPFAAWQTVVPLASWLAPVFLLRFARTARRPWLAYSLIFVVFLAGGIIGARGLPFSLLGLIGNNVLKSALWTLAYRADGLLGKRLGEWPRLFVFPLTFTAVDWALSLLSVSTSGSPAYSQDSLALMQIVSVTGMWGLTFIIMWFASTVNALWEHKFDWKPVRAMTAAFGGVLLVVLAFGGARMAFEIPSSQHVAIATVTNDAATWQAAVASIDMKFNQPTNSQIEAARPKFQATLDRMLERTETALRGGAKIVSWGEESAWTFAEDRQIAIDRASALARQHDAYIQVSLGVFTRTPAMPCLIDQSILIDNTGRVLWAYDKARLVPFDEVFFTIPGKSPFPFVDTPYGRLGCAICWENYFPAQIRQLGLDNVDILLAPSNDPREFALSDCAVFLPRAIENGFSLVRACGHGRTLVTDCEGRTLGSQDYFTNETGIMLTSVPTRGVGTVYSRIGDVFAYLCVAGLAALIVLAFVRRERS